MDTVVTDGVTYTKASVIAKRFHYTSDYVGQLCRSGKATCQLIGRSWYVDETSLSQHKDSRYKEIRLSEISKDKAPESSLIIEKVYPRPNAKDVRRETKRELNAFASVPISIARYHDDNAELLPQPLRRIAPIVPIPVELEDSTKLAVESENPNRLTLEFTPMPEVPLQGRLEVHSVGFDNDEMDTEAEVVTEADLQPEFIALEQKVTEIAPTVVVKDTQIVLPTAHVVAKEVAKRPAFTDRLKKMETVSVSAPVSFTPVMVSAQRSILPAWSLVLILVMSAFCLSAFLVLSSHVILIGRYDVSSRVVLTTSALSAVQTFLP